MAISEGLFRIYLEGLVTQSDIYLGLHQYIMHFHASISLWDRLSIGTVVARDLHPTLESLSDIFSTRVIIARLNLINTWV